MDQNHVALVVPAMANGDQPRASHPRYVDKPAHDHRNLSTDQQAHKLHSWKLFEAIESWGCLLGNIVVIDSLWLPLWLQQ